MTLTNTGKTNKTRQRHSYYPLPFLFVTMMLGRRKSIHTHIDRSAGWIVDIDTTHKRRVHSRPLRPHTNTRTPTCMHTDNRQNAIDIPNTYYSTNIWNLSLSLSRKKQNNIFILVLVRAASYVLATGFPVKLSCSNFVQAFPRLDSSNSDDI